MPELQSVLFPYMRLNVIEALRQLSDFDYQQKHWIGGSVPSSRLSLRFADAVHWLFDDTALIDDPESCVGDILKNDAELRAVLEAMRAVEVIYHIYGYNLIDIEYTQKPKWAAVVVAAQEAFVLLDANQQS